MVFSPSPFNYGCVVCTRTRSFAQQTKCDAFPSELPECTLHGARVLLLHTLYQFEVPLTQKLCLVFVSFFFVCVCFLYCRVWCHRAKMKRERQSLYACESAVELPEWIYRRALAGGQLQAHCTKHKHSMEIKEILTMGE